MRTRLGGAALLLGLAFSAPAGAEVEQGVAAGLDGVAYATALRTTGHWAFGVAYARALGESGPLARLHARVGLRAAPGASDLDLPLEAHAGLALAGAIGPWAPEVGPELGVSGLDRFGAFANGYPAAQLYQSEQERAGPLYLAVRAAPLRFRLGPIWLSALELTAGSALPHPGSTARLAVRLLGVEVSP